MSDQIDNLFKPAQITISQLGKRKLDAGEPTLEKLKKFRSDEPQTRAEPEPEVENDELDVDEEDGRFYGGGVSKMQQEIFNVVDQLDQDETTTLDASTVKRMVLKFEKAINKNQEQRMRYPGQPIKFVTRVVG
jgi:beta-catenin-like protein 1